MLVVVGMAVVTDFDSGGDDGSGGDSDSGSLYHYYRYRHRRYTGGDNLVF